MNQKTKLPKIVRPKKGDTAIKHSISLPPDVSRWTDTAAEASGVPFSNVIATALEKLREEAEREAQPA
ncbi:hypothetical protein UFOVP505_26 [uncultured Caudovirales phage]|uniref:Uncharacterized protein n=1 Tax=uncultured Caudovirales phage TaxID=2100421 RepID=A0A6J5MKM5_9CAUD|nr:hypothetical protein UFOVP505_26 [uncultured Caudovirales phage]